MLRLPAFLRSDVDAGAPESRDLNDAFAMTGFFLERHVFEPRGLAMHEARARFIAAVLREEARVAS
jgi:DNA repair protein RecO (recombination protein O)